MSVYRLSRVLPFPPHRLFDLVMDVERYPEFVPGYRSVRVKERGPDSMHVVQQVGLGSLTFRYHSVATFEKDALVRIHAAEPPFTHLDSEWRFTPKGDACTVDFTLDYELDSPIANALLSPVLESLATRILRAFESRAQQSDRPGDACKATSPGSE